MSVLKWELYPPSYTTLQVGLLGEWMKDSSIRRDLQQRRPPTKIDGERRQGVCGRPQGAADPVWCLPCTAFGQVAAQWALFSIMLVFSRFEPWRIGLCLAFFFAHFRKLRFRAFFTYLCIYPANQSSTSTCGDMSSLTNIR